MIRKHSNTEASRCSMRLLYVLEAQHHNSNETKDALTSTKRLLEVYLHPATSLPRFY